MKAVNEITARQTRTSLRKHDDIKVRSMQYLTTEIELVLPTFKSWTVHKITEYLTLGLLASLRNIYHSTTAYFFDSPCTYSETDHAYNVRSRRLSLSLTIKTDCNNFLHKLLIKTFISCSFLVVVAFCQQCLLKK